MKIVYKVGNLLDAPENVIAHGCNAQGVMGSGVAKAIKDAFPQAFRFYHDEYKTNGLKLGYNYVYRCDGKLIVNMITQERYGSDTTRRYVDYAAVRACFTQLNCDALYSQIFSETPYDAVAMPLIGCGLGNGSWAVISRIIEEEARNFQPVVYCLSEKELNETLSPIGPTP